MKKRIFLIVTSVLSAGLCAQSGFYMGGQFGLSNFAGKRSDTTQEVGSNIFSQLSERKSVKSTGPFCGLFGGFLYKNGNFGVGPELFWQCSSNMSNNLDGIHDDPGNFIAILNIKHEMSQQVGFNVKGGYFYKDNFLYGLIGLHCCKIDYYVNVKHNAAGASVKLDTYDKSRRVIGSVFGIGWQRPINDKLDIGLEFKMLNLPKKRFEYDFYNHDGGLTTKLNSQFSGRIYTTALRVIYKI